jgi:hypothetical protein
MISVKIDGKEYKINPSAKYAESIEDFQGRIKHYIYIWEYYSYSRTEQLDALSRLFYFCCNNQEFFFDCEPGMPDVVKKQLLHLIKEKNWLAGVTYFKRLFPKESIY